MDLIQVSLLFSISPFNSQEDPAGVCCWGGWTAKPLNITGANTEIPGPMDSLQVLKQRFNAVGLDDTDLVALSGNQTHTILIAKFYSKMAGAESN